MAAIYEKADMFLVQEKLEKRTRELETFRYTDLEPLAPFAAMPTAAGPDEVNAAAPETVAGQSLELGDEFRGRDRYLWLRKTLTLPAARPGCTLCGLFDFGETGGGHNSGFESLLYVDRQPYQGVDSNHPDVVLEQLAGQEVELTFLLWTGLEGGGRRTEFRHIVRRAHIGWLHAATDELYYLARAITETIAILPDVDLARHQLTAALDDAFHRLNWDDDKLHASVPAALAALQQRLAGMEKHSGVTVDVIGHTHIDVAWLWRLKHTREKALRSFATVLRLMEEFDEYLFLQTQPQLYQYVKNDCPALYEKIKARVAEGRWEADGGMWVEADCNISSGEALVRQLMHGTAFFKEEFGRDCEYLWLPDVFGYSWALPQILKLANIKTFVTTKISWNQFNTMPHDLFRWRGIDGSEVLTYFLTTPNPGQPPEDRYVTYNGLLTPYTVQGSWLKFRDKDISSKTLISYGYGDGGGGVNREMLKMRRAMDKLPGLPNVKPATAREFLRGLHNSVEETDRYVATWDGELYLEYHRGTYTSQGHNKLLNRRLEYAAARTEWLASLAYLHSGKYDGAPMHEAWEAILLHQFHDIIPGSSIREVYEDSDLAYAAAEATLAGAEAALMAELSEPAENSYTLWHAGSFARRQPVWVAEGRDGVFYDEAGEALPAQRGEGGWWVQATLPALSLAALRFAPGPAPTAESPFSIDLAARRLISPTLTLHWDEGGRLTSILDKANLRQVLAEGALGNALEIYEDKPLQYDNWDLDIFHLQKAPETLAAAGAPQLVEAGPLRAVLRFTYKYNLSTIEQDMIVTAGSPRIDFETRVDWHEKDRLLKAAFPVDIRATRATYDIQFGHAERPTHFNTSWDYARFEVVGHKWADLSESDYGVSLLNDCKYGYSTFGNTLRISLLKSTKYPDFEADMGSHTFTYALLPHAGAVTLGDTIEQALALNLPVLAMPGRPAPAVKPLFTVEGGVAEIDAVKKADAGDCLVLRLHECRGAHHKLRITSGYPIEKWAPCNLLEEDLAAPAAPGSDGALAMPLKPFEIKTFKVYFKKA